MLQNSHRAHHLPQLSIEIGLEEERKAREEGGEEAAAAVREARQCNEGLLKAFCRLPGLGCGAGVWGWGAGGGRGGPGQRDTIAL